MQPYICVGYLYFKKMLFVHISLCNVIQRIHTCIFVFWSNTSPFMLHFLIFSLDIHLNACTSWNVFRWYMVILPCILLICELFNNQYLNQFVSASKNKIKARFKNKNPNSPVAWWMKERICCAKNSLWKMKSLIPPKQL